MKRIFFTLSFLVLFGVAVSAQINFVTSGGPIGTDVNYAMDGYTGDKNTSGSGTATYGNPENSFSFEWSVDENGNITITCGACGKTTTLKGGATKEAGSGSESHTIGGTTSTSDTTWVNIDFM